jgi:hypothetical protein
MILRLRLSFTFRPSFVNQGSSGKMHQVTSADRNPRHLSARIACSARADGGRWTVLLDPDFVIISRRVNGMRMHLSVPIDHYEGVAIAGYERQEGSLYRIRLVHPDPELSVTLKESRDRPFIIDAWAEWAAFFAAPLLIEDADGAAGRAGIACPGAEPPASPQLAVKPGSRTFDKSVAKGAGLSPRPFLRNRARSRSTRTNDHGGLLGPVIRGEREIISYD